MPVLPKKVVKGLLRFELVIQLEIFVSRTSKNFNSSSNELSGMAKSARRYQ